MFQNQQARICLLYLPLFELLYQNLKQLSAQPHTSSPGFGLNVSALSLPSDARGTLNHLRLTKSQFRLGF